MTFPHLSVHRNLFTGAYAHQIVEQHLFDRNIQFFAVANHPCGFRLQADQAFDSFAGASARFQLQRQPQINQTDDDGSGFEVDMPRHQRHCVRCENHHHGVEPCRAGAQGNQGVHVGGVIFKGLPGAHVKVTTRHDHHGQGQQPHHQPDNTLDSSSHRHLAHHQAVDHQRHTQCQRDPGLPHQFLVIGQIGLFFFIERIA